MTYAVKEIFYTLQGEGANAGRPAVFCRFAGCNLWSGREEDRADAVCRFCDTDFVGTDGENGGKYRSAGELVAMIASLWPQGEEQRGPRRLITTGSLRFPGFGPGGNAGLPGPSMVGRKTDLPPYATGSSSSG